MNVIFCVDGGQSLGMGHIMRCLSLAMTWKRHGHEVVFFSRFPEGKNIIMNAGFQLVYNEKQVKADCLDLDVETNEIITVFNKYHIDVAIIDHYSVTLSFFLSLKPHVNMVCYIDDLNAFSYPVDVVINGNITALDLKYRHYFEKQQFLLGSSYNLIRDEFKNIPKRIVEKDVRKIFITTGGSDPFGIIEKFINFIRNESLLNDIELHVIIGNSFQNKGRIKEKQKQYKNIVLYENVKKISSVMQDCDIAVSSCGSTLYELCTCGLPTLGFILADNQALIAEKMNELGYIKSIGWYHQLSEARVIHGIKELMYDFQLRRLMVERQQTLVDGYGTERIVAAITKMMWEKEGGIHE